MKITDVRDRSPSKNGLEMEKEDFPLVIIYKDKWYRLVLTKNDKLMLNRYAD